MLEPANLSRCSHCQPEAGLGSESLFGVALLSFCTEAQEGGPTSPSCSAPRASGSKPSRAGDAPKAVSSAGSFGQLPRSAVCR